MIGIRLALALALAGAGASVARAETDWGFAAATWKKQLTSLYEADLARRLCNLPTTPAQRAMIKTTIRGLEQALYGVSQAGTDRRTLQRETVKAAGGRAAYCKPGSPALQQAEATLAQISQKIAESQPQKVAASPAPAPADMAPTPVIDPDISLIRNCRKAVMGQLGRRSASNAAFWPKYEDCMSDQGAGWF